MNPTWDRSWFKLSFYAIFTFICIYIAKYIIDTFAYTLTNMAGIYSALMDILGRIFSLFSVIIGGFVIAYILSPTADMVQRKLKVRRSIAVAVTYGSVLLAFVLLGTMCLISTGVTGEGCIENITRKMADYADNINIIRQKTDRALSGMGLGFVSDAFDKSIWTVKSFMGEISENALSYIKNIGNKTATFLLSILVSFYFIKDGHEIKYSIKEYGKIIIPKRLYGFMTGLLKDMNTVFSGYIRGQLTDAVIMSSLLSLGLAFVKVPFAIIIGLLTGFLNIIPYFGCFLGIAMAVLMSLISGKPIRALYAVIVIGVLQQIDSAFIAPKIVGNSVKLSPLMIIISLAVAGRLFGLWGLVLAVPSVAVAKLRLDRYCERKRIENE